MKSLQSKVWLISWAKKMSCNNDDVTVNVINRICNKRITVKIFVYDVSFL